MEKINQKIRNFHHKEILVFSLIMFIVYFFTMSCSPDDQDSIHFFKGLEDFNILKNQPHPPGFPIYIFVGKIFLSIFQDELLSLTILSAIFGTLTLIVFYFLIYEMFNKKTALMSTILLSITALFWLYSLKAMADMIGLFFIILSLFFIYKFIKYGGNKNLYLASFISAISAGVRIHAIFILFPLLIYCYFKSKNKKAIFYANILFIIGILIWLIPMILISEGPDKFFEKSFRQFFRRYGREPFENGFINFLSFRIQDLFLLFFMSFGINPFKIDILFFIPIIIYSTLIIFSFKKISKKNSFIILGLFIYLLLYLFVLFSNNPRYLLPIIPFLCLFFVLGTSWFGKYQLHAYIVLFLLTFTMSLPLALEIRQNPSPIIHAISYTKDNYDLNQIKIYNEPNLIQHLSYFGLKNYSDNENKTLLYFTSYPSKNTNLTLVQSFKRNPLVHYKHSAIYIYKINNLEFLKKLK